MNIKDLKKDIESTASSLEEQVQRVLEFEGRIPQIDIDIMMGSIRKLYEDIHLLNKLNKRNGLISGEKEIEHPKDYSLEKETKKEADEKPEKKALKIEKPSIRPEEVEKPEPEAEPDREPEPLEKLNPPIEKSKKEDKPPETTKKVERQEEIKDNKRTIDLFDDNNSTIADKFLDEQDKSIAAKIKKNKISDLKSAIGINDKFLFINELFDGNMHEYNEAIDQLNSIASIEEAIATIDKLKEKHNWEEKGSFQQLVSYVERRF